MNRSRADATRVAIVGYAHTAIERHADLPLGALAVDCARDAIADAGLQVTDVDGFVGSALLPTAGRQRVQDGATIVTPDWLARHIGAEPRYVAGFSGVGQIPGSVALAVNAIASGAADVVVLHRALHNPRGRRYHANRLKGAAGDLQWTAPQGYFGPLAMIALPTNEYMQRYGASREDLAAVVVEARKNGARIPWSYWHGTSLTGEDYLDAPTLFDPITRYDCDIPVDGVATFVLTTAERAKHLPHRPVYVAGFGLSGSRRHRLPQHWPLDDIIEGGQAVARRLWTHAGVDVGDVDLPQVYDGFSPLVWWWLEVLGFCPVGEAHQFVSDGGIDSDQRSALPALSGGGALGNGRMHGVPQMLECYLQLSGRAGDRQRAATVRVACHSSPHYGGAVAYTNE